MADPVPGHEEFAGMLAIPYFTRFLGGPVAWKFRPLDPGEGPKYLAPHGQKGRVYGAQTLRPAPAVLICEGELDALLAHHVTRLPALGVPGVSMWKPHHARIVEGFPRVLVLADNDADRGDGKNPGRELGKRICEALPQASVVPLPPGDLTDFVVDGGDLVKLLNLEVTQ